MNNSILSFSHSISISSVSPLPSLYTLSLHRCNSIPSHVMFGPGCLKPVTPVTDRLILLNQIVDLWKKAKWIWRLHQVKAFTHCIVAKPYIWFVVAYLSEDLFDAHLTPLGWQQVDNLRNHVKASGISNRIELVVVSPLLRTLQTAVGTFGGEGYRDGVDATPLMTAGAGNSDRPAIASLNFPPFIAVESCREHLGVHPCDRRSNITKYRELFPAVDFSLIETDEDVLWKPDIREENQDVAARGVRFMNWLSTRKEKEIAVVTHSGFLYQTLNSFGNDCHPAVKSEISSHFANCELRSFVLVDKCMNSSDPPVTNYPGKIHSGEDLPSDFADEK